jgi:hypothetical protein
LFTGSTFTRQNAPKRRLSAVSLPAYPARTHLGPFAFLQLIAGRFRQKEGLFDV